MNPKPCECGNSQFNFHPNLEFSTCLACKVKAEKDSEHFRIWGQEKLSMLVKKSQAVSGRSYDVLLPIRGDGEDYFTLRYLLEQDLSVLVLFVNSYFYNDIGWHNVHNLITEFDVDSITFNPRFETYRDLVADSLNRYGDIYVPYKCLHFFYAHRIAFERKIPLIIWGQCQPLEYDGKFSPYDTLKFSRWWFHQHEHNSGALGLDVVESPSSLIDREIYRYPCDVNPYWFVGGYFLSNFMAWDQFKKTNEAFSYGMVSDYHPNSFNPAENCGSDVYYDMHAALRRLKKIQPKSNVQKSQAHRFGHEIVYETSETYNLKPFFTKFLGSTNSGYDWFVDRHLPELKSKLISSPHKSKIGSFQKKPSDHFLKYYKGI